MRRLAPIALALALSACSMAPKYVRPDAPVPPSWPVGDAYLQQSEATIPAVAYSDIFHDRRLQALVEQAPKLSSDSRALDVTSSATGGGSST